MELRVNADANAKNFAPTRVPLLSRLHEDLHWGSGDEDTGDSWYWRGYLF